MLDYQEPHRGFCREESQVPSEALIGCGVCVCVCEEKRREELVLPGAANPETVFCRIGCICGRQPHLWLWLTGNSSQERPPSRSDCAPFPTPDPAPLSLCRQANYTPPAFWKCKLSLPDVEDRCTKFPLQLGGGNTHSWMSRKIRLSSPTWTFQMQSSPSA